jgi:hypothetical protein
MEKDSYFKTSHENLKDAFISNCNRKKLYHLLCMEKLAWQATTHINLVDQTKNDNNNYIRMGTTPQDWLWNKSKH